MARPFVVRCHLRTERRSVDVWVTVRRHGRLIRVKRTRVERVVVPPHAVTSSTERVPYGQGTTVGGWLGTPDGTALAGRTVRILSAPDNGQGAFAPAATVTTTANGGWTASLPPGPSRLIEAVYDGDPTTEPSTSPPVQVIVPASVKLISVSPRRVAWDQTVRITGQLEGGYLPRVGALVRLRYGYGSARSTYGVQEHVSGDGRFTTTYTFGAGDPGFHRRYWFQIASLPMGNYPFAPASSARISVLVGGDPPRRRRRSSVHRRGRRARHRTLRQSRVKR